VSLARAPNKVVGLNLPDRSVREPTIRDTMKFPVGQNETSQHGPVAAMNEQIACAHNVVAIPDVLQRPLLVLPVRKSPTSAKWQTVSCKLP
jgi:hypothetical protein